MIHIIFFIWLFVTSISLAALVFTPLVYFLRILKLNKQADMLAHYVTKGWGRLLIFYAGGRVKVYGRENIPETNNLCVVSNHQSYGDIPLLLGYLGKPLGFVAKNELRKIPILNLWMIIIHSVFLDRGNPRKSIPTIHRAARYIQEGHPIAVFPEGTRAKDGRIKRFKKGSFKLATICNSTILPVTIDGTFRFTSKKGQITGGPIRIVFHKPVETLNLDAEQRMGLAEEIETTIAKSIQFS